MERIKNGSDRRAITIAEAAEYACVSRATLLNWISLGLLPYEELPSRGNGTQRFRRIRMADLVNFLDSNYTTQTVTRQTEIPRGRTSPNLRDQDLCRNRNAPRDGTKDNGSTYQRFTLLPKK